MIRRRIPNGQARQRGAGALVVVILLYVAMALLVVFTNRSLIFEQKSSGNQYRSTVALEAAEAGLEWANAMLNKTGKVNSSCLTSTAVGDATFKDKYLQTTSGSIAPRISGSVIAACAANQAGGGWSCSCPASGTAPTTPSVTAASGYTPGFAVAFQTSPTTGTVELVSYGCTSAINGTACGGDAAAKVQISLGQISALSTPPAAPLTARGQVSIGNAALGVINSDPTTNGITINAGMGIDATNARITSVPGTPPKQTLVGNDQSLRETTEDQMFATFFGMTKAAYRDSLPSTSKVTCPCTETTVQNLYNSADRVRVMWLTGDLVMNANATIGSETDPFILIVDGTIEMRGDLRVFGVLYSTGITWDNTGGGSALLQGAAISEGNYTGNGTPDYFYDPRVLGMLNQQLTTFVRVPGSWKDF